MSEFAAALSNPALTRRIEFAAFYLGVPLLMTFAVPPSYMWPGLAMATVAGLALLMRTEGFRFSRLLEGRLIESWAAFAGFFLLTTIFAFGLVLAVRPEMLLYLPRYAPAMWLAILALYPLVSVAPQELIYRVLFFERYGVLFPDRRVAVLVNAAVFGMAHMFFWNWIAVGMTFVGGVVFSLAYLGRGGFLWAGALHAVAGQIIFTSGLGVFFYHGAAPG
jgi:membrane protease YdiL (CAAX protease family)